MKKLTSIICLLLIPALVYSQEKTPFTYTIDNFGKGYNSQVSEYSIIKDQATIAKNVRFNNRFGALGKRVTMLSYGSAGSYPITGMHRYYKSDGTKHLVVSGSTLLQVGSDSAGTFTTIDDSLTDGKRWMFVTYKNMLIGMNGSDNAQKWDGSTSNTANTDGHRTATELTADLGAPFAELNTGANLDASSWYQYKVAYYDGTTYSYSTARSNPILTGSSVQDIALTDIPLGPTGTTNRYVYRTLGNASQANVLADTTFYKVATIADNTTTTLSDTMDDATAAGDAAPTWATVSAGTDATPPKGKYPLIHDERLWIAGNTTNLSDFYWSDQFNPDYFKSGTWYEQARPDDGDPITFFKEQLGIITIGKTNTISKFYTSDTDEDPNTFSEWYMSDPLSFVGCPAPYSVANSPRGLLYLARDGIYAFGGQYSKLISDAVTPDINDILDTNIGECVGLYYNDIYQLAYTSAASGSTTNNRVLVFEIVRNAYSLDYKDINSFCVFNSGTDFGTIYSGSSGTDGTIFAHDYSPSTLIIRTKSALDLGTYDDTRTIGTEKSPVVEMAWDCTIDGWLTELQTKDASINTINDINTYLTSAIIDRPDLNGTWTSAIYRIDASDFDQLYWNESLGSGGNITWEIKGCDDAACSGESFSSSAFTDPSGSDVSGETADVYVQLQASFSTDDATDPASLYLADTYVVKLTYTRSGQTGETSVPSEWQSGWTDLGRSGYKKWIKRIKVFYEGTSGNMLFAYENEEGNVSDSFTIDLSIDPADDTEDEYTGTDGYKVYTYNTPVGDDDTDTPIGQLWRMNISESGIVDWKVNRIELLAVAEELDDV